VLVGYLKKSGFELFEINKDKSISRTNINELKGLKRLISKKILIIDKALCLHVLKKYPPASRDDISKALSLEINDLFPYKKTDYYFKITTYQAYTLVDIWGWDSSLTDEIKDKFPYIQAIAEEACFFSEKAEISISFEDNMIYLLVYDKTGFLGSVVSKKIDGEQLANLLRKVRLDNKDIGQIKVFDNKNFKIQGLPNDLLPMVSYKSTKGYPFAIEYVRDLPIKRLSISELLVNLPEQKEIFFRAVIYILIGYLLSLFISSYYYDSYSNELKQKIALINSKLSRLDEKSKDLDKREIEKELNDKLKDSIVPIDLFNMLAQYLPEKTFLKRININDRNVELQIITEKPLEIIKILNNIDEIESLKVKGAFYKDQKGQYNITILLVF